MYHQSSDEQSHKTEAWKMHSSNLPLLFVPFQPPTTLNIPINLTLCWLKYGHVYRAVSMLAAKVRPHNRNTYHKLRLETISHTQSRTQMEDKITHRQMLDISMKLVLVCHQVDSLSFRSWLGLWFDGNSPDKRKNKKTVVDVLVGCKTCGLFFLWQHI